MPEILFYKTNTTQPDIRLYGSSHITDHNLRDQASKLLKKARFYGLTMAELQWLRENELSDWPYRFPNSDCTGWIYADEDGNSITWKRGVGYYDRREGKIKKSFEESTKRWIDRWWLNKMEQQK